MKHLRTLMSLVLAACLLLTMSAGALAAEDNTFSVAVVRWTEVW